MLSWMLWQRHKAQEEGRLDPEKDPLGGADVTTPIVESIINSHWRDLCREMRGETQRDLGKKLV